MKALKIEKTVTVTTKATFKGATVTGDVHLLSQPYKFVLGVNWEGRVTNVFTKKLEDLDIGWFEPSDKGGLSLFLADKNGKVFAGLVRYENDNILHVVSRKDTETWY